jgi:hypothetical protein
VLLNDRGAKGTRRTIQALGLSQEAKERVIRLTSAQHKRSPAEILEACCERHPGAEAWFLEGLDLWITNPNDMAVVAPVLDGLQRLAARRNVAIIGSVGAPKQKGQEKDKYYGRDSLFGSAAFGRKVETVVLISPTDADDANSVRQYSVLPRNGRAERFWMAWTPDGLVIVDKPADKETESKAFGLMKLNVFGTFKVGEVVTYLESLGPKTTFYRWREVAAAAGLLTKSGEKYYRSHAVQK